MVMTGLALPFRMLASETCVAHVIGIVPMMYLLERARMLQESPSPRAPKGVCTRCCKSSFIGNQAFATFVFVL